MSNRTSETRKRPLARLLHLGYEALCKKAGFKILMKQLANQLQINPDQLSRYYNGVTVPYKDTEYLLHDLAEAFQVPYQDVLTAARERPRKGTHYTPEGSYTITVYTDTLEPTLHTTRYIPNEPA